ncbi:hypothetical protein OU426_16890 [Frigidibacter sp. RF13]|uniref:hypothetical protein n=1 Tax=Frigidibacter sp. RF13 TaxID=2997340 RepID=UPI002271304C|nr:hypothetical protein [Frigidibacter sp. RF13]MCY1128540.1 hypothetical protein [Frigidibacter sp. RF13]
MTALGGAGREGELDTQLLEYERLTLFIAAPRTDGSVWVSVVDEVSGPVFEQEITADLAAETQFLSPWFHINIGATVAAVAFDCAGVYLEVDI